MGIEYWLNYKCLKIIIGAMYFGQTCSRPFLRRPAIKQFHDML